MLRTLASTCEFENLKDGLKRDRVICEIRNQALKERLLRETSLTLKSAVDIRRAAEVSREQVKSLTNSPHANIDELNQSGKQSYQHRNYSAQQRNESNTVRLFNCGNCGQQHAAKSCPAYGKRCNNCHKIGHFSKLCRSTKNTRFRNPVREVEYEVEYNLTEHGIDTINTSGSSQHGKSLLGCRSCKDMNLLTFHNVDHLGSAETNPTATKAQSSLSELNSDQIFYKYAKYFEGIGRISEPYHLNTGRTQSQLFTHHVSFQSL